MMVRVPARLVLWLFLVASLIPRASGHWVDDPRLPDWAQRGRTVYLDATQPNEKDLALLESYKAQGATPFVHAFTPHWPNDKALVERLRSQGIPVDVRVEAALFFEDDHIDRFAWLGGKFQLGGWWMNHAWRTNYNWWYYFPESVRATTRRRNGDEKLGYSGHHVTVRREGSPIAPEHRSTRAKQIAWLLSAKDPIPEVPMRPNENPYAKDPKMPYPMLGAYSGLWYDNPSSGTSYDPACRMAWERHFREKFGVEIWDPPSHPDPNVRREWGRFWAEAWTQYYLWRKQLQDDLLKRQGKPLCHTSGNFSFVSHPHGTSEFYFAKRGIVDMPGPSEYVPEYCGGRFHFLIKAMLAATHGRPGGKFYPDDLHIAESLAVAGTNTYRPADAAFLAANVDLFGRTQPGARVAVLFHVENNLVESQLVGLLDLVERITALGFPYEVVTEDDLELDGKLSQQFPLLVVWQTDCTPEQVRRLNAYVASGGRLAVLGDCLIEQARYYDLASPPARTPPASLASALGAKARDRVVVDPRSLLPSADLRRMIEQLGGPGFRLAAPDPDVLLNILRQPTGDLVLAGLVNYSGKVKNQVTIQLAPEAASYHAGWISRDGGGAMLTVQNGAVAVPELRYGCMVVLGKQRSAVERIVERNAARFPRAPLAPDFKMAAARQYGPWHAQQIDPASVPADRTLCRHRVGATDRAGFLLADITGPKAVRAGSAATFDFRLLDTRYDYIEYWQLIFEDTATGQRTSVAVPLPAENPHGETAKLRGTTWSAPWTPPKPGLYQAYLAYRVTRLTQDGEPTLAPEKVFAGYGGGMPANLYLKSQPLEKRPCEDRLRGMVVRVE